MKTTKNYIMMFKKKILNKYIYFDFIMSNGIGYQTVSIPRAFYYTIFSEVS